MKKLFSVFIGLIVIALVVVTARVLIETQKELEIKRVARDSSALKVTEKTIEDKDMYYAEIERLNSQTFMDEEVNTYIDSVLADFLDENEANINVAKHKRAVLTNTIDSYDVNGNIYGIRIKFNLKKIESDDYTTIIKTFNFDKEKQDEVSLDEIFKSGYENIIGNYDQYLLKHQNIGVYNGQSSNEILYNRLKEYAKKGVLTPENLNISEEEYNEMFKNEIDPNKKMVAITFDDGPNPTNTPKILEALKENNAKATFFMLGQNAQAYPDTVKAVYDSGSEIGIHTWDHPQLTKLSQEKILKQVNDTSDVIFNLTGYRPKIIRPPYGAINDTVKSTLSDYPLILWNIDSLDWKSRDENKFVPLVMNQVQDGDIILLHDIHSTTVPGAEKIISQLTEQGYQLVTVSELLETKGYDTTKTHVFYSGRQ